MFTRRPGSSLYTLTTQPAQTLLWHHRLGHPSLPRLCGMHSHLLVSGLPKSLPPLPPSPTPPCLPCVKGRQRAAPHSSWFPLTTAPLHTLLMDVCAPARVSGQGRERNFLLVVDDYMRYTTVFPLCSKGEVLGVLIPWIRAVRLQLRENLPVPLPASPLQNGIAERCIGLVMEVFRTSMIHAAAPGWQFYHPTLRRVLLSQNVTFEESVPFYCLFPYRTAPLPPPSPPPPLFLTRGPPPVDPLVRTLELIHLCRL
ncbi:unnamed protein product [Closterium sp. NIES-53]